MAAVAKAVVDQFAPTGVTVKTLGFADKLSLENAAIPAAINGAFMANQPAHSAQAQVAMLPIEDPIPDREIGRSDAKVRAGRWKGKALRFLPSWIVILSDIVELISAGTAAAR